MGKNKNWFGQTPSVIPVKAATSRVVRFGNVAKRLVPGAGAALDAVYIERQRAVAKKGDHVKTDAPDLVLRLVSE